MKSKLRCDAARSIQIGSDRVRLRVVLLQLSVERGLPDAEQASCGEFIPAGLAKRAQDGEALKLVEGQEFVGLMHEFGGAVLKVRGEVAGMEDRARAERDGTFDGIFKFADVSGPIVGDQAGHGVFGNLARVAIFVAEFFEERIDQERDVSLAFAERRHLDLDDVEAEKKVLAE